MQCSTNIAGRILRDVPESSQRGHQLLELLVSLWQLSTKWLEQVEEARRLNATCSEQLE